MDHHSHFNFLFVCMFASMGSLAQIVLLHTVGLNLDRTYSGPHLDPKMLTLNVSHTRSRVDGAKQSQPPLLVCVCVLLIEVNQIDIRLPHLVLKHCLVSFFLSFFLFCLFLSLTPFLSSVDVYSWQHVHHNHQSIL